MRFAVQRFKVGVGDSDYPEVGDTGVMRWRRYGQDRLYVATDQGDKLGWYDLITGGVHLERPELGAAFTAAVNNWLVTNGRSPFPDAEAAVVVPQAIQVEAPPTEADQPAPDGDLDLATQRAGATVRAWAAEAQQAAPVRTRLARVLGVHTEERARRLGAKGEEKVGAQLDRLAEKDSRWRFVHSIPVGENGSDIDHLVVGPGGVFTLNAKHHPGARIHVYARAFYVNGHRQPYLRNSEFEARRAARLLTAACGLRVTVTGVVVPVNADDIVIKGQPAGCAVVNRMRLADWLRRLPETLPAPIIETIYMAARRLTTWQAI